MRRRWWYLARLAGVVLVGAMVLASSAAASASAAGVGAASPKTVATSSSPQVGGNAAVVVPPALVAASDGLAHALIVGKSYELEVHVWLAAGQPQTNASVTVSGAYLPRCDSRQLIAGKVVAMRCRVTPTLDAIRAGLVVSVVVDVHAAQTVSARFAHSVVDSG
jgi:hypothetical protein